MGRVVDAVLPPRLGRPFRWLVASNWASNLGDGIGLAAGPLLVASQTRDPLLVAAATLMLQLPALLFGLLAGALADRLDRRLLLITGDLVRAGFLVVLSVAVLTDTVNITVVLVALFLLGTAEVFVDNTFWTLVPMVVGKADYGVANARLFAGFIVSNQLLGPPVGAFLFAAGMTLPFVTEAVLLGCGALLLRRIALPDRPAERPPSHIRRDIAEGVRWVWHHPAVRTLTLTIVTFNVTFGAAWSVLVLYALERLHLGEVGFGLLTGASAVGGLLGTAAYGWLERRLSLSTIMRTGLVLETLTHLGLALTTEGWVAMVIFFLFGAHAFVWSTTALSVRQRAVPTELQGRVSSTYSLAVYLGTVVGGAIGGVIARQLGVVAPFWFAFAGSLLILVCIWRQLDHIAHADEQVRADPALRTPHGEAAGPHGPPSNP